ncbi:MAG: amidohydrolase [Proteobacteria bacterium]|nr:amidohydrolase [Pseudomonadota bacterium]MBU4385146.1 amidohydrolase [Pseudomonadota bacterium]MBU4603979.1 amidohydrolase [Pseudomonadota bacterium]MCG2764753.1 amidohydrolase [Desulfarculaceae bacterium]
MARGLIISGGPLWAGPGKFWPQGAVAAVDGVITYAGPAEGAPKPPQAEVIHAEGGLIMPGLVNAHCHGAMVLFRGLADDLPLHVWLEEHMFPAEARWVSQEMVELCSRLAAAEMLLSGTTTVGDSYFCLDGAARAYASAGIRAALYQGVIDFPAPGVPDPADNLATARRFLERWKGESPLLSAGIFAHSTYTCSEATLRGVAELAAELGCLWHTHLAETAEELGDSIKANGCSPMAYLEKLGLLESLDTAVHCVWLQPGEEELLARREVAVAACPGSNSKLGSGWADAPALLAAGVAVGLGTDGAASNNNLDLFGEIGLAARLAKVKTRDPAALPAEAALDLALSGGAACLGLEGVVGRLEPGYACDAVVMDLSAPRLTPCYDAASHLVYAATGGNVRHVVVNGRQVVNHGALLTMDVNEVMAKVRELAAKVGGPA